LGIFSNLRREFILRPDAFKASILFKWPDTNIRNRTQLTVEQDELAVFFRDGKVNGVIQPGVTTLDSSEIPFLGNLIDAATGGRYFKTELYFVSTREFPNLPFGGMVDNVVDPETGLAIGLRVFGDYSLRVVAPERLILNLVGTQDLQSNDQITDWMRDQLLKVFRTDVVAHISTERWPILGIAAQNEIIEKETLAAAAKVLDAYGLSVARMGNFVISIKPEDEETLKKYRRDVQYTKLAGSFQVAAAGEAMEGIGEGAAKGGESSAPSVIAGMGLAGTVFSASNPAATQVRCPSCNSANAQGAQFCGHCGKPLGEVAVAPCAKCGQPVAAGTKFCPNCGAEQPEAAR
jgi:membrane protease subunit (stomatin/prohibitin family)